MGNEPRGPWHTARELEASIAELEASKAAAGSKDDRRSINQRLQLQRDLLKWCKTRAGYIKPDPL